MIGAAENRNGRRRLLEERGEPAPLQDRRGGGRFLASDLLGPLSSLLVEFRVLQRNRKLR